MPHISTQPFTANGRAYRPPARPVVVLCLDGSSDEYLDAALADFFEKEYDGQAAFLVLAHLSEHNNHPEVARETANKALGGKLNLFQSCALTLAQQDHPLQPLCLG